jgi:hypothetical protein
MTIWTDGSLQIQFNSMNEPPFNELGFRRQFADRLELVSDGVQFRDAQLTEWPPMRVHQMSEQDQLDRFLSAWDWYLGVVRSHVPGS